ncbi:hypothetical protein A3B18_01235 [Candidatus Giovannonibacteria bacterium RIFCSPLOWO2_01_FULL_46_13]|uniref:Uncharacterized protein n=1 Tax=Candidatus Giovannonibacteria bacterium RIFCSPLOWO2_01_FULL_46_13 TaxID=1798352 RepID=A0A1F5X3W3_9BACT|nr:MAG: hypothetical protein A3B18_01235 [Candidatus Giovannonibacteria bacterium RIFCSPLOWO2_01_FULL_46_13]
MNEREFRKKGMDLMTIFMGEKPTKEEKKVRKDFVRGDYRSFKVYLEELEITEGNKPTDSTSWLSLVNESRELLKYVSDL